VSSWSYALTNKGRQLQAKAQTGAQLVYTRMAVGSGTLSGQSLESMTALIAPVKDLTITRLKRPAGSTRALIGATLTNQDVTTGFYLREVGIFAEDPDDGEILYMYANSGATADYITPQGDGVIEKALNMNVFVGSAANITANIDESLAYATQQDLADAIAGIQINEATTTQKGIVQLSNATNSTAEDRAATPKAVKSAYDAAVAAQTTANAANEAASQAFQLGNERKQEVVDILIAKGISASTSESWESLLSKMTGIIKATGNATAADVLAGKTFSNATGNGLQGTMPNRGAGGTVTPGTTNQTKAAGYYSSSITVLGDADLVPGNIRRGVDVFGVKGEIYPGELMSIKINHTRAGVPGERIFIDLITLPGNLRFFNTAKGDSDYPMFWNSSNRSTAYMQPEFLDSSGLRWRPFYSALNNENLTNITYFQVDIESRTFFWRDKSGMGRTMVAESLPESFDFTKPFKLRWYFYTDGATNYTYGFDGKILCV